MKTEKKNVSLEAKIRERDFTFRKDVMLKLVKENISLVEKVMLLES